MAESLRPERGKQPVHVRREELVRPVVRRRDFQSREAQHVLELKEGQRWAPVAYAVFLIAALAIFGATYTTYAFSKYRGVVLPGVHVDQVSLAGETSDQANATITNRLAQIYGVPITLTFQRYTWHPRKQEIGLAYDVPQTVQDAMNVGRKGPFIEQLLDRLPIHPDHAIPLLYKPPSSAMLRRYVVRTIASTKGLQSTPHNANLKIVNNHVILILSRPGQRLDVPGTERAILSALGSLSVRTTTIPVLKIRPVITDAYARSVQSQVERFLSAPPVLRIGKRVVALTRTTVAPMLSFAPQPTVTAHSATINLEVNSNAVASFVASLAAEIDRPAQNPLATFKFGRVVVVRPRRVGRTLDQAGAVTRLLAALRGLKPRERIRFHVIVTQPTVDLTNPASLGINRLLGIGESNFVGAGQTRLNDIIAISQRLDNVLIQPNEDVSFNQLVGTSWPTRVYLDQERESAGSIVPGPGGAMQQVATTFLRAMYASGLKLDVRYSHTYRLSWYEPPIGLDAVVTPGGEDLVFTNDTGKALLLQTRVEPIRQELYIYVYGPRLPLQVTIDRQGKILEVIPHGPPLIESDPLLAPGQRKQIAWAHDGAVVVVRRTITRRNGTVTVQELRTRYKPWRAIIKVGPSATPTPTPAGTPTGTPSAKAGSHATPGPSPTPTFNH
jgi:vancomycin resistance protein YoaR